MYNCLQLYYFPLFSNTCSKSTMNIFKSGYWLRRFIASFPKKTTPAVSTYVRKCWRVLNTLEHSFLFPLLYRLRYALHTSFSKIPFHTGRTLARQATAVIHTQKTAPFHNCSEQSHSSGTPDGHVVMPVSSGHGVLCAIWQPAAFTW